MRNLKKYLSVLLAVAMLLTAMVPAFAAETFTYSAQAKHLNDLGLYKGISETSFNPDLGTALDRQTGIVMLLRVFGLEDAAKAMSDADATAALAKFTDASEIADWAKKSVAYATKNGLVNGVTETTAAPKAALNGKAYATLILRQLGYTVSANDFNNATAMLAEKGGLTPTEALKFLSKDLVKDDLVGMTYGALTAKDASGKTVAEKLIAAGVITVEKAVYAGVYTAKPTATPTPTPTPAPFAVEKLTSDNLKTVTVHFNKEVDKDTVNTTNFSVTSNGSAVDAKLLNDKKSVVVVLSSNTTSQSTEVEVTVKDVKDTAGNKVSETKRKIVLNDTVVPEVLSVVVYDAKNFDIMVSEPVYYGNYNTTVTYDSVINDIKIDGNSIIAQTKFDYVNNKLEVKLATKMNPGTHEIEIAKFKDYAGIQAVTKKFSFDIAEDTKAPELVKGTFKSTTKVELEFDERIDEKGKFKIDNTELADSNVTVDGKKVTLEGGFTLNTGAIVEIKIEYKDQKDVVGNKVSDWKAFTFKVEDDTTLPTVSVAVGDNNKLTFTFSKSMSTTAGKIVLKDKDGVVRNTVNQPWTFKSDSNSKILELTPKNETGNTTLSYLVDRDGAAYTVEVEDFVDTTVRANKLPKASLAITAKDTKKPVVEDTYVVKADGNDVKKDTITFFFSEAVQEATATLLSNYFNETTGKSFSTISDVKVKEFASDGKSVTFFYPSAGALTDSIRVYAIKDVAGNVADSKVATKNTTIDNFFIVGTPKATAKDKVEIFFNAPIRSADPSAFKIKKGTTDFANFVNYSIKNDSDKGEYKVTFTVGRELDTAASQYSLAMNVNEKIESIYGKKYVATGLGEPSLVDGIRPTIKDVTTKDARTVNGTVYRDVEISISEVVYATDLSALLTSLVIKDSDNNIVAVGGSDIANDKAIIAVSFKNGSDAIVTPVVGQTPTGGFDKIYISFNDNKLGKSYNISFAPRTVKDFAGNTITEYTGKTVTIK